jgi:hypothetical protein
MTCDGLRRWIHHPYPQVRIQLYYATDFFFSSVASFALKRKLKPSLRDV